MAELLLADDQQYELAHRLFGGGLFGIKEEPADFIELKSKRMSPHYLDIRPGISNPFVYDQIVASMAHLTRIAAIKNQNCDFPNEAYTHVVGTPEAMTSYAALIASELRLPILQPRVNMEKTSGNKTPILGRFAIGDRIAAYDDVITDGQSKIDTISTLRAAGLDVADYFVVVDREEGGAAQVFEETGLAVTPALAVSGITTMLRSDNKITVTQFDNVKEYLGQYGAPGVAESMGSAL